MVIVWGLEEGMKNRKHNDYEKGDDTTWLDGLQFANLVSMSSY